jgi:transposase InsO family protein
VPQKQPKRGRLWLNDGSCIRLRAERRNQVWSYDFVSVRDAAGTMIRLLTLIDEYTRECLAIHSARNIGSDQVIASQWLPRAEPCAMGLVLISLASAPPKRSDRGGLPIS